MWPTKGDRSRGFLIPRALFQSCDPKSAHCFGNRLELGYFIPFGDSVDTTLYADLNNNGYNGFGIDLRYLPSSDVKLGELNAYVVHDSAASKEQWKYSYKHSQENLPGGFRGVVDVEDISDLDFFRNYDRDARLHTLSQIYSSAYLTKNPNTYSVNILADRRDIILGHVDPADLNSPITKQRFEQLPSMQFRIYPNRLFGSPILLLDGVLGIAPHHQRPGERPVGELLPRRSLPHGFDADSVAAVVLDQAANLGARDVLHVEPACRLTILSRKRAPSTSR